MKRALVAIISISILAGSAYILGYSTFFTVSSVEISGSTRTINAGVQLGEKLARVEPREIATRLERLDWIESVDVSRNWISGKVEIILTERTPIALYKDQVIDSAGKSFVQQGVLSPDLIEVQATSIEDAVAAVAFFTQLPEELNSTLSVIKVRSTGALVMIVNRGVDTLEIRWGTNSDNQLKYRVYQALLALPENLKLKRVDVSAPNAPIVK